MSSCCRPLARRRAHYHGKTIAENVGSAKATNPRVIRPYDQPLKADAGFMVLRGNLFDSAMMKTSVISEEFRRRYLCNPEDPNASRAARWCSTGRRTITRALTIRRWASTSTPSCSCAAPGAIGYPGSAEVVNMRPPAA